IRTPVLVAPRCERRDRRQPAPLTPRTTHPTRAEAPCVRRSRCPPPGLATHVVIDLEGRLLRRRVKSTRNTLAHRRHEHLVAEPFPTLGRVVDGDDRPPVG